MYIYHDYLYISLFICMSIFFLSLSLSLQFLSLYFFLTQCDSLSLSLSFSHFSSLFLYTFSLPFSLYPSISSNSHQGNWYHISTNDSCVHTLTSSLKDKHKTKTDTRLCFLVLKVHYIEGSFKKWMIEIGEIIWKQNELQIKNQLASRILTREWQIWDIAWIRSNKNVNLLE